MMNQVSRSGKNLGINSCAMYICSTLSPNPRSRFRQRESSDTLRRHNVSILINVLNQAPLLRSRISICSSSHRDRYIPSPWAHLKLLTIWLSTYRWLWVPLFKSSKHVYDCSWSTLFTRRFWYWGYLRHLGAGIYSWSDSSLPRIDYFTCFRVDERECVTAAVVQCKLCKCELPERAVKWRLHNLVKSNNRWYEIRVARWNGITGSWKDSVDAFRGVYDDDRAST